MGMKGGYSKVAGKRTLVHWSSEINSPQGGLSCLRDKDRSRIASALEADPLL